MWNWIGELERLRSEGRQAVVVTVAGSSGSAPREIGAKMIVLSDGEFLGTVGGGHLEELALNDARAYFIGDAAHATRVLREASPKTIKYPLGAKTGQCCGGTVDLLFEPVNCGPRLYLFGAGHVGQAVCRTLAGTPFRVHLVDERDEWVNAKGLPPEISRHHCEWDEFVKDAKWDETRTYVAIMTHRHDVDQDILEDIVARKTRYIGLIGSRGKWERFKQRLEHKKFDLGLLERVKCPLGLDIGGKAPQEVAISLAAELLRTHYGS